MVPKKQSNWSGLYQHYPYVIGSPTGPISIVCLFGTSMIILMLTASVFMSGLVQMVRVIGHRVTNDGFD